MSLILPIKAALAGLPWKLIALGAVAICLSLAGWRVSVWHDAYETLPGVQAELAAERACEDGSECYARQQALQEAAGHATVVAVQSYEAELAAIRSRPARIVRLCPASGAGNVRGPGPAPGTDGAAPGTGGVPGSAGPDIGVELYRLARDADEVVAMCRALQGWNAALAAPKEPK